ncbi:MAG: hypothetical protein ABIQ93_13715 [Saprospiraceae bacterium]
MSTFLGNCCLGLAALLFGTLITFVFNYKPPIGGNGGANPYGILILLYFAVIFILMAISAVAIAQNGGFDWVSAKLPIRFLVVTVCLLAAMIPILYASIALKSPTAETAWLSRFALVVFPVILVGAGFVLLNAPIRQACPAFLYKWPLVLAAASGLLITGLGIRESWIKRRTTEVERQSAYENSDPIKARRLDEIGRAELPADLVRILEMIRIAYPPEVREAAVAKVSSYPEWPQKLLFFLENDHAPEAICWLAYNDVPDKKQFAEPLRKGILAVADGVRAKIQVTSPSDFSRHEYSDDVTCVLRAVERFEGLGTDFRTAVQALRSALDEPLGRKIQPFAASAILDDWLAKHPM